LSYKGVEKAQKSKLQSLQREYERYKMFDSGFIEQYFSRITYMVNKMMVCGKDIPNNKVVDEIIRTMMPMKYNHVVTMLIQSHDINIMTLELTLSCKR